MMDFFSTYKLYKQGTSQVVTWLGKTAAQFGYKLALADRTNEQEPAKKTSSKRNADSATKCQVTKYTAAELPALAEYISKHFQQTSTLKTLPIILTVLKDVIIKRKEWAKAFELPGASTSASNKGHKHFVTVLEDVYEVLGGAMSALQQDKGKNSEVPLNGGKSTSIEEIALSNLFAVLDIEESVYQGESGDQAETIHKPARRPIASRPPATTTYELEDEIAEDEIDFMIFCFFKDFQAVRSEIRQSWADYTSGMLDLASVAVTTNVALEMLQRAEIALLECLPEQFHLSDYVFSLLNAFCPPEGEDPKSFLHSDAVSDMDLQDVMEFFCWPVFEALAFFLKEEAQHLLGDHLRVVKHGRLGKIDLTGRPLSWKKKLDQHKIVLYELLPDLCLLRDSGLDIPYVDELTNGLAGMIETDTIPIWLALGCQIYLDTHYTMLSDIGMAHRDLQIMGRHFSTTLQEYLDFLETLSFDTFPVQRMKQEMEMKKGYLQTELQEFLEEADLWTNCDILSAIRKRALKICNLPEWAAPPYYFFSRHPLLCGLLLFCLNVKLQEYGIFVADTFGPSVLSVIHLYNAVKREALKDGFPIWQDLEAIIRIQGKERLFLGKYPKNAAEYLKRWCLVTGVSASMFALNRRKGRHTSRPHNAVSKRGRRVLITISTTADIFGAQYVWKMTSSEVTFHKIVELLSSSSLGKKSVTDSKQRPIPFTSVSFLSSLQAHIQSDILALNIDFFSLHFRCSRLLRDISVKLEPQLGMYRGEMNLEGQHYLYYIVSHLFGMVNESEMASRKLKLVRGSEVASSAVLVQAGELIKALVEKEGDKELQRVRSVCRGYARMESTTTTEDLLPACNSSEEKFQGKNRCHSQLSLHLSMII